jgi:hypothetical protein
LSLLKTEEQTNYLYVKLRCEKDYYESIISVAQILAILNIILLNLAELFGGESRLLAKLFGKVTLIRKSTLDRNLGDRHFHQFGSICVVP